MPLVKSKIEYIKAVNGFNWGIITGCNNIQLGICKIKDCWAQRIALKYKRSFEPTFHSSKRFDPIHHKKSALIWVCLTGEIFSDISNEHSSTQCVSTILRTISECPQHTFFFLTKRPEFYQKFTFPKNCWLGTTVNYNNDIHRIVELKKNHSNYLWISFEPLYDNMEGLKTISTDLIDGALSDIDWIIIGGQTNPSVFVNPEGVANIVAQCSQDAQIFMKDNSYINRKPTRKDLPYV